jgi:CelD/BcsL family acetyltransferase involved in cellulose biosynthesis
MRMLMEERRFAWFDFTEGDGQHKRQFATGAVDSLDLLLLRPTFANLAAARTLTGFDGAVALAKRLGLKKIAAPLRR